MNLLLACLKSDAAAYLCNSLKSMPPALSQSEKITRANRMAAARGDVDSALSEISLNTLTNINVRRILLSCSGFGNNGWSSDNGDFLSCALKHAASILPVLHSADCKRCRTHG